MVRKYLVILVGMLLLSACGQSLVHDDFREDLNQVLEKTDEAYEENREMTDEESDLLERFSNKYKVGQFYVDDEVYKMSDIEKETAHKTSSLYMWTDGPERLSSETSMYEVSRGEINELLEMNEVPNELENKHPTYELLNGMYAEQFETDASNLLDAFDSLVNGNVSDVDQNNLDRLNTFLDDYDNNDGYPNEYIQDDKHFLMNDSMRDIIYMYRDLKDDINGGGLRYSTIDKFNDVKEDIEIYGNN